MLFLRSLVFNLLWYINIIVQMVVQSPIVVFMSRKTAMEVPRRWANSSHVLHRWITGTKMEVLGAENIPDGGCIVASKHQSIWEFYGIYALLPDSAFVLKSELMKIPFFGWYLAKVDQIPIRRGDKGKAMRNMIRNAKEKLGDNRQILIFPEGTRKVPGEEPNYRYGVTRMYLDLNCPVVPVALTSGLYWPRRKFVRYPGTIRVKFLEAIQPGLSGEEFTAEMTRRIEEACDELYWLTAQDDVHPPLNDDVKNRIVAHSERINRAAE